MTTIRVGRRARYTIIDRGALNDRRLSFRARGILAYLLDKPDDWQTSAEGIASAGSEGREAVRTALNELEAAGYLARKKWRNQGRWMSEWTVYEKPKDVKALVGTRPDSRRRQTGAGEPLPFPGPQLPKTDTEKGASEASLSIEEGRPVAPPWLDGPMTRDEWFDSGRPSVAEVEAG